MKNLQYILICCVALAFVACGKTADGPFGELPDIYADAYESYKEMQDKFQATYNAGATPSKSMMEKMVAIPKKAKEKAEKAKSIVGNRIDVEDNNVNDFLKIDHAEVDKVRFDNNSATIFIKFIPAEGQDVTAVPRGSVIYYICLDKDNTLLFRNALFLPSTAVTTVGLSLLPHHKASPERWNNFSKIKIVSKKDFYAMGNI